MDVLYYWKNHEADMKAGRIGHFKSTVGKVRELSEGFPDFLWVFTTPRGRKGHVQLLAKLKWADRATVKFKPEPNFAYLHYDPNDRQSVIFADAGIDAAVAATSKWALGHFPKMVAANFQGTTGQEALRGAALNELAVLSAAFGAHPFSSVTAPAAKEPVAGQA
jgi:hypothetical protein